MMRAMLAFVLSVSGALAATPVASVTSSDSFQLNGVPVSMVGIRNWPVAIGDEIATSGSPAVLLFPDMSRIVLEKNSRVKLEPSGGQTNVRVVQGDVRFDLAPASTVQVTTDGVAPVKKIFRGSLSASRAPTSRALPQGFINAPIRAARGGVPPTTPCGVCRSDVNGGAGDNHPPDATSDSTPGGGHSTCPPGSPPPTAQCH